MNTVPTIDAPPVRDDQAPPSTARPAAAPRRSSSVVRWWRRGGLSAVGLALPTLLVFGYFSWKPLVQGITMSFQKWNFVADPSWVGLSNFEYVLSDPLLGQAVLNTLYFTVLAILFGFPLPILLAVAVSTLRGRTRRLASFLAYLPVIVPPVVAILLWKVFYDSSESGLFNRLLGFVGIPPQPWLNDAATAMPSIVLEATWAGAGTATLIYLAAITSVRPELYEAAELDGAGILSRIWHVTLPQLRTVILIMLLLQIIGAAQVFAEPFLFTGGGPQNATLTVLVLLYRYAFNEGDYGAATALGVLLALVLAGLSALYLLVTKKWND
ncbi:sugar ABC transporter permease [Herbiconiux sp. 11R-BC]|uniref:carbohydrate ABC transporter permease n=1 Tax=Herbiconiux sp. 11R-BC TaxID=3111637 RepID=UPI003C051406